MVEQKETQIGKEIRPPEIPRPKEVGWPRELKRPEAEEIQPISPLQEEIRRRWAGKLEGTEKVQIERAESLKEIEGVAPAETVEEILRASRGFRLSESDNQQEQAAEWEEMLSGAKRG